MGTSTAPESENATPAEALAADKLYVQPLHEKLDAILAQRPGLTHERLVNPSNGVITHALVESGGGDRISGRGETDTAAIDDLLAKMGVTS